MARAARRGTEAGSARLFVAIEVPDREKAVVWESFAPWRERFPRARWVPPENQHVTVRFLGATALPLVPTVLRRVEAVAGRHETFETRVTGVGAFPSPSRARVVWAGLDDPHGSIAGLARAIDDTLAPEFEPEHRAFRAHLTVARCDPPLALPGSFVETALQGEAFPVERLVLVRSHLRRPAPRYEVVGVAPLARG